MSSAKRRWLTGGAAFGLVVTLAACGGGDDSGSGSGDGPVTLELWSDKQGAEASVRAFNEAHEDVQIELVSVPAPELPNTLNNAHEAGDASGVPCLAQTDNRQGGALLAQGVVADIGEYLDPHADQFAQGAIEAMSIADSVYAVPNQRQPIFTMFHAPTFEERGLEYPTSWEEAIEVGRQLREDGIYIFNLAGEDPSTWMNMAWQAGARWYSVEGDAWKIDFTNDASRWASGIMQQLLDEDLVERISYAEYPAMMQQYDNGRIAMRQLSTWQLAGHQRNADQTLGEWQPAPNLTANGETEPLSAGDTSGFVVPSLCEDQEAAVEAAVWLATQEAPLTYMADPAEGSGWFPAVTDPSPYLDALVPTELFGDYSDETVPVIEQSENFAEGWVYGPNSRAMYEELADQWGKAMNGDITVESILEHMQEWTVNDLREQGVNVVE
ncbi:ABC transporter substrate-binding protein [Streptomyces litchfieldiae]|uniref:Extracellular solute-binding protein n=1 Tax=Streptomyces litchfieldiae TaxID=3075543 RepID=A0ABU2MS92_9ACTN|nr:extracellular solute-binding protein [Streptomyces sp. DSM 44938]MDT0344262.1 extracellular solute-binding protein [Streptomyces sp. DSM 44938]